MIKSIVRRLFKGESATATEQIKASFEEGTKRFIQLIRNVDYEEKIALAGQSCLPEEVFAELAQDDDADVRYAVGENLQTPSNVLLSLAKDTNSYVAERAVRTLVWVYYLRFCLEDLLIQALQLKQEEVRDARAMRKSAVASNNGQAEATVLEKISALVEKNDAESLGWLIKMAEHRDTNYDVLTRLSQHKETDVRIAVADNPTVSLEILQQLATDSNADVRYALAENHNIDQKILLILMGDDNPFVSQRAQKTLLRLRRGVVVENEFAQQRQRPVRRRAGM